MVELLCGVPCFGPHEALPGLQRMRHCWGLTLGSMLGAGVWQRTRSAEPLASEGTQSPGWSTVEPAPKPVTQGYVRLYKRWCGLQGCLQGAGRVPLPWAEACVLFSWEGSEGWGGGLGVGSPGRRSSVCRGPGMSGGQDSGAEVGIWGNT